MAFLWSSAHVLLLVFLLLTRRSASSEIQQETSPRRSVDSYIDRFVGCRFQDICDRDEICFDDGLFGVCVDEQKAELVTTRTDEFSEPEIKAILEESGILDSTDWSSLATQCRIRSLLFSLRYGSSSMLPENLCEPSDESEPEVEGITEAKRFSIRDEPENSNDDLMSHVMAMAELSEEPEDFSVQVENTSENDNGKMNSEEEVDFNFLEPLSNEEEAQEIAEDIDPDADYKLSPDGKHLSVKVENSTDDDFLDRLRRSPVEILVEKKNGINEEVPTFNLRKSLIIGLSVACGSLVVCLAVAAPFIARRVKRGQENVAEDDEKCLTGKAVSEKPQENAENGDLLAPLAAEAHQRTKSFLSGFFSFGKNVKKEQQIERHSSHASVVSNSSGRTNSTSSNAKEPPFMDIDITTGHLILTYLEKHLHDKNRLDADWKALCAYEPDDAVICEAATLQSNLLKNRPGSSLPYEQSRVKLRRQSGGDYINASLIYDHEPQNPAYVLTQTPMGGTVDDFWQMIWDQSSTVIVSLDRADGLAKQMSSDDPTCAVQYWPEEGWERYGQFEVYLVSEHMFCGREYLIRSFYLKNIDTNETRTVTQFHYLGWPTEHLSEVTRSLLEFRRRVNRSFRGKCCPTVVHCPDGGGIAGTYLLLDMVLGRINRGIKELDIAATLEHLRDQRQGVVQTKEQFEFVLSAIAEEVNALLKNSNGRA